MGPAGFSHSETPGSKRVCRSPGLIAACRVLHRLPVPRHPPCALTIFLDGFDILLIPLRYHTGRARRPGRSDAIFCKKIFGNHAMRLSGCPGAEPWGPETAPSRARETFDTEAEPTGQAVRLS